MLLPPSVEALTSTRGCGRPRVNLLAFDRRLVRTCSSSELSPRQSGKFADLDRHVQGVGGVGRLRLSAHCGRDVGGEALHIDDVRSKRTAAESRKGRRSSDELRHSPRAARAWSSIRRPSAGTVSP